MHIHSKYSCDSETTLEEYCEKAIRDGIDIICFSDHIDLNPNDPGCGYYEAEKHFADFHKIREKYKNKLFVLCGIEFGDPHVYTDEFSKYSAFDYDFILGTVHFWYQNLYTAHMVLKGIPMETCFETYWEAVLTAVKYGGFDTFGHLDFPKRYYGGLLFDRDKISEIYSEMLQRNITLEINTSSLRKKCPESMPDKELLSIYKECGGKYITFGSDSHRPHELAYGVAYAKELIAYYDFEEVYYMKRERFPVNKRGR